MSPGSRVRVKVSKATAAHPKLVAGEIFRVKSLRSDALGIGPVHHIQNCRLRVVLDIDGVQLSAIQVGRCQCRAGKKTMVELVELPGLFFSTQLFSLAA